MDELTVNIERREDCTAAMAVEASRELQQQIKIHVGSSCKIVVADPGTLARSSGKLRRVYDLRDNG